MVNYSKVKQLSISLFSFGIILSSAISVRGEEGKIPEAAEIIEWAVEAENSQMYVNRSMMADFGLSADGTDAEDYVDIPVKVSADACLQTDKTNGIKNLLDVRAWAEINNVVKDYSYSAYTETEGSMVLSYVKRTDDERWKVSGIPVYSEYGNADDMFRHLSLPEMLKDYWDRFEVTSDPESDYRLEADLEINDILSVIRQVASPTGFGYAVDNYSTALSLLDEIFHVHADFVIDRNTDLLLESSLEIVSDNPEQLDGLLSSVLQYIDLDSIVPQINIGGFFCRYDYNENDVFLSDEDRWNAVEMGSYQIPEEIVEDIIY